MSNSRIQIREHASHTFAGSFPQIERYAGVDWELLTAGDNNPFVITLAVAEIGRTSRNGLIYDNTLVNSIAEQLRGSGGIRGHIPDGEESTSFPVDAVDWIGHLLDENGVLWAKGYIPPGDTREQIRRAKARGGSIGTSIYGYGVHEPAETEGTWYSREFELHSLDLAPAKMASLQMGGDFLVTSETLNDNSEGEGSMPEEITLNDVPDSIREQIIQQAQLADDMGRVQELAASVETLTSRVSELEDLGAAQETRIAELTEERDAAQAQVAEFQELEFNNTLDARIAELTNWQVSDDANQTRLDALRTTLRRSILTTLGAVREEAEVETAIQSAWTENEVLVDTVREALSGPAMRYGNSKGNSSNNSSAVDLSAEDAPEQLKKKYGAS